MTMIHELFGDAPTVSFEFFPPKTPEGETQLAQCLKELEVVEPSFVSVTYGAGGTTRDRTRDLVIEIDRDHDYPAMPHLTCMSHTRGELEALLDEYAAAGIANILALGGDPPADGSPATGDFTYAEELVGLVRDRGEFSVAVAAFPEGHPRSASRAEDLVHLARKLGAADFGITQFFFSADHYLRMRDDLAAAGCETPVLPGIMPLLNPDVIRRFAAMNGTTFPEDLAEAVTSAGDGGFEVAVGAAVELTERLLAEGVPGVHLYCLNRAPAALAILEAVGLASRPA